MITWKAVLKIQGSTRIEGRKGGKYLEEDATHGWQWRKLVRMDVRVLTGAQPDPPLLVWLCGGQTPGGAGRSAGRHRPTGRAKKSQVFEKRPANGSIIGPGAIPARGYL